jgi:tubulin delta
MSLVTLQLGQCGNQIGCQFFQTLNDDLTAKSEFCTKSQNVEYFETSQERFFSESSKPGSSALKLQARAVMVDMEPKVIAQTLIDAKRSGQWMYPEKQQYHQQRGSGNNWAHGFNVHGPRCREMVMSMVQREVEKCDHFGGFVTLMSLAGGTGSGVGAHITQCLRDEFPSSFIVNQVVWPYTTGEVIVQNYNAVLTMSHLYQCSDAVLTLQNDVLQRICSQLMALPKVSFKDINKVAAHKLTSILQPAYRESSGQASVVRSHLGMYLFF